MATDWNQFSPVEPAAGGTNWEQFKPVSAPEAPKPATAPKRTFGQAAKDTGLGIAQGAANLLATAKEGQDMLSPEGMLTAAPRALASVARRFAPDAPIPVIPEPAVIRQRVVNKLLGREAPEFTNAEVSGLANEQINRRLSPALQEDKQALSEADGFVDSAKEVLTRPRLLGQFLAEQVPNLLTLGAGSQGVAANAARSAVTRALGGGATEAAAQAVGREAGQAAAQRFIAAANAGMESAPAAQQAQQEALNLPDEVWESNPAYRAMVSRGVEAIDAKRALAADSGMTAGLIAAATGYIGGKVSAPFEAEVFTRQIPGGARSLLSGAGLRRTLGGVAREASEEVVQEGGGQFATNVGVRQIDPSRDLMEGVPEAAGTAAVVGGALGGGLNVAGTIAGRGEATPAPQAAEPPPLPPIPPPLPDMGQHEAILRQSLDNAPTPEAREAAYGSLVRFLEENGRLLEQQPITVGPDGTAVTPEQATPGTDGWEVSRPAQDLTPDVRAAQVRHPGFPLPDPANGPLSRVVNDAAGAGALPSQQPLAPAATTLQDLRDGVAAQPVAIDAQPAAPVPAMTAEERAFNREQTKAYLLQQATRGPLPDSKMIATSFGMKPREASELRREVVAERRAADQAERAARAAAPTIEASNVPATTGSDAVGADATRVLDTGRDAVEPADLAGNPAGEAAVDAAGAGTTAATEAPAIDAPPGPLSYDESTEVLDSDITPPSGGPFSQRAAADVQARRVEGGRVFEVDGGFVVRTPKVAAMDDGADSFDAGPTQLGAEADPVAVSAPSSDEVPAAESAPTDPQAPAATTQQPAPAEPVLSGAPAAAPAGLAPEATGAPTPQTAPSKPAKGERAGGPSAQATPPKGSGQPKVRVRGGKPFYDTMHRDTVRAYYTPGREVASYGGGRDRVLQYRDDDGNGRWSVQVQAIDKDGNPAIENGRPAAPRWHSTAPGERELAAVFGKPQKKARGTAQQTAQPAPTAAEADGPTPAQETTLRKLANDALASSAVSHDVLPGRSEGATPDAEIQVSKAGDGDFRYRMSWHTGTTGAGGPWGAEKFPTAEAARAAAAERMRTDLPTKNIAGPGEQARIDAIRAWLDKTVGPAGGGQSAVAAAAEAAATSDTNDRPQPTPAQKEAGNYAKGHLLIDGLDISIENPAGSRRRPEWPPLKFAYGYFKGTIGKDKDHVDVFLHDDAPDTSLPVFVIDQNNRDGGFDEHKVMLGFADEAAARAGYMANYTKGWSGLGAITRMDWADFKTWVRDPERTKRRAANDPLTRSVKAGQAPKPAKRDTRASTATEDAGEELWYNRRGRTGTGLQWADIEGLNSTLKVKEAVKSKVWPRPDYDAIVQDGLPPVLARVLKTLYDSVGAKPATRGAPTDEQLRLYVEGVQKVRESAFKFVQSLNTPAVRDAIARNDGVAMSGFLTDQPVLNAVFPSQSPSGRFRGEDGIRNNALASLLGGNRMVRGIQVSRADMAAAIKDVADGWPASKEAWERQFIIRENRDGTFTVRGRSMTSQRKAGYETFPTREAAIEHARTASASTRSGGVMAEEAVSLENAVRTGAPRRATDEDVTSERLMETFGFRGVNFGNWMKGGGNARERQLHLNHTYDAFADLAEVLNLPAKALSLDGMLGIAFGAQGIGGSKAAAAHFVPGVNEINLTRAAGVGSLAHEWAHALDHYFAVQGGEAFARRSEPFITHITENVPAPPSALRPEVAKAFRDVVTAMRERPATQEEIDSLQTRIMRSSVNRLEGWLKHFRTTLESRAKPAERERALAEFDALADRLRNGDLGEGYVEGTSMRTTFRPTVAAVRNLFKDATGRVPPVDDMAALSGSANGVESDLKNRDGSRAHVPQSMPTAYLNEARVLDRESKRGGGRYWTQPTELFARAFQSYVLDRLAAASSRNDYLTRPQPSEDAVKAMKELGLMAGDRYPRGVERERINGAMETLTRALRTRDTDRGVALFSQPDQLSTPEFRNWFGDSKVVDEIGNPLVVYHGTTAEFENFDPAMLGTATGAKSARGGFFFASNRNTAASYASEAFAMARSGRDGLARARETLRNLTGEAAERAAFRYVQGSYRDHPKRREIARAVREFQRSSDALDRGTDEFFAPDGSAGRVVTAYLALQNPLVHEQQDEGRDAAFSELIERAKRDGHDGVIIRNTTDDGSVTGDGETTDLFIAFRPEQIRTIEQPLASRPDRSLTGAVEGFRAAQQVRALSRAQVQAFIAPYTSRWGANAPKVTVLEDPEGLPDRVKVDQQYRTAEGFYDDRTGTVYLIAPNIRPGFDTVQKRNVTARERALNVLVHEVVGHYGIEAITGRAMWEQLEQAVEGMRDSGRYSDLFAQIDRRYRGANRAIATREAIAVMAEKGVKNSVMDRVVSAIRRFLRDTLHLPLRFSESELRQHIVAAARYIRSGSRPRDALVGDLPEAFASRPDEDMAKPVLITAIQGGKFGPLGTDAERMAARERARAWLENMRHGRRTFTNTDTGWKIGFSRVGVQEMLYWTAKPERIEALAALPALMRNAVLADTKPNANPPRPDIADAVKAVHTFYAPLRIGNETRIARLVVRETVNGSFAYDLQQSEVMEKKSPAGESPRAPDTKSGAWATQTGPERMTIAEVREAVNADRRPDWRWSNPGSVVASVDGRGNRVITDGETVYVDRSGRFYLSERGRPVDFTSFADARARADALGMDVLLDDPVEGQRPSWSVVVPEVLAREALVGERFFSQPDTIVTGMDAAAKGPDASLAKAFKDAFRALKPENLRENTRPAWLGALTLRHLAELGNDLKLSHVASYADRVQQMSADRNVMQEEAGKVADEWETFQRKDRAGADATANLMHDATLLAVDPSKDYAPLMHTANRRGPAEPVTAESVRRRRELIDKDLKEQRSQSSQQRLWNEVALLDQLWEQERDRQKAYPGMVQRWLALPETGRTLYVAARDAYEQQSERMEQALVDRIQALEADERTKAAMVSQVREKFEAAKLAGPYFPLQRFGDFWISAKDPQGESFFSLYESAQEWRDAQAGLKGQGYTDMKAGRKLEEARSLGGASGGFMADLQGLLETAGVSESTRDDVYQLYLRTLPELSVRKHQIHRKGIAGYSGDALRAFSANLFHGSFQIARLRHTHELEAELLGMKKDVQELASKDAEASAKAGALYNEMGKRHEWVMNPRDSAVVNNITSLAFAWYLGTTPAAAFVNLTQTAIVTFPVLAAKFGVAKAANYLTTAMARSLRNVDGNLTRGLSDEERAAFKVWYESGAIEKTQSHALAGLSETDTRQVNSYQRKAMQAMSFLFHKAEVVNREATALAAFRLAREDGMSFNDAAKYAGDAIWESHFDYSNANRARWVQSNAAKVLLLFRQYSMNMTWFLWRNLYQSLKGQDQQVRREARAKLAGVLGMTSVFAGAMGLPLSSVMFGLANAAAAAFGDDDDEPFDAEVAFRNFLADTLGPDLGRIVARGPVDYATGLSFSSRVSLNDLWLRDPDRDLSGKEQANYLLEQAAGPVFGGMLINTLRGISMINEGHTWRGVETMMPKAVKDSMKAIRYGTEGVNTLRGDPVIEDLGVGGSLLQLAGFSPASLNERYDGINAAKNYEERILGRREALLNAYAMAWRAGDAETVGEVLAKVRAFNEAQPELAINTATIRRSLQSRLRYSARAEGGVVINPKVEGRAREQSRFAE